MRTGGRSDCRVWPEDGSPQRKSEHYGDAEFLDQQLRLLDLVPRQLFTWTVLTAVAVAAIVGLQFAYAWMAGRAAAGGPVLAALDVAAKGSLASWFSSLLLLGAVVAALLTYTVRRHRTDDYQGRYRVWIWAAAACLLLAADQATGLRAAFREMMTTLTGTPLLGNGDLWWVVAYAIIFGAIGSRVLIDVRSCIPAAVALSGAAIAHAMTVAQVFGWELFDSEASRAIFRSASEMTGNLLLLAAFGLFARHVVLDAEGLLPRRRQSDREDEQGPAGEFHAAGPGRWRKIDPPHVAPPPAYQRPAPPAPVVAPAPPTTTTAAAPSPISRKLTKGERKALKARLLRERMERERRAG